MTEPRPSRASAAPCEARMSGKTATTRPDLEERHRRKELAAKLRRSNSLFVTRAEPETDAEPVVLPAAPLAAGAGWQLDVYGRGLSTERERRAPRKSDQDRILAIQGNVCMYCGIPIGTVIGRAVKRPRGYIRRTTVILRRNWDHFAPYSYIVQNPGANWVLACHVCNNAKSTRIFTTVDDARRAILPIREERGYESVRSVLGRLATSPGRRR